MKIGVLGTGYNCAEYFHQVLEPWLQYKEKNGDLIISAVSGQFTENELLESDNTKELMLGAFNTKKIDYLALPVGAFDEAAIRNFALSPLLQENVDLVWLLDFDEIYKLEEIEKALLYTNQNPLDACFKIEFKNYVFADNTYIKGFCPRRIWRKEIQHLKLNKFIWDNDCAYADSNNNMFPDSEFSALKIPANLLNPKHLTWLDNERSKQKCGYQEKHFVNGAGCSFKWEEGYLKWNLDYFKKTGQSLPILHQE